MICLFILCPRFSVPHSLSVLQFPLRLDKNPFMTNDAFFRRRPLRRFLRNWLERHRNLFNRGIHCIGIPLAFAGIAMFFFAWWPWALAALVGGYVLQWIGHRVEGNDMGEWAGIKRLLGWPYVAIAPRWQNSDDVA